MASYTQENDIVGGGYGFGGGGGMFAMIILLVVVFWVLFRGRDGFDGREHGHEGFGFGGCGPCVRPSFLDESNFEEERNINSKLCKIEMQQQECCCKELEATHCEGEKTRALIEQNYIQDLRDKLTEKNSIIQTMKSEAFTAAQIGMVNNKIEKVDEMIERLACELPKRPPVFSECVTPNTHDINCREDFGRRGRGRRCDFDFDGCCA